MRNKKIDGLNDEQQERFNSMLQVLAERVRTLRKSRGMSGRKFAEFTGISHATLVLLEGGAINISLLIIFQIAEAMKVDISVLLDGLTLAPSDESLEDCDKECE